MGIHSPATPPRFLLDQAYDPSEALAISILAHVRNAAVRTASGSPKMVETTTRRFPPIVHASLEDEQEVLSERFRWHEKYGPSGMRSSVDSWHWFYHMLSMPLPYSTITRNVPDSDILSTGSSTRARKFCSCSKRRTRTRLAQISRYARQESFKIQGQKCSIFATVCSSSLTHLSDASIG